MQFQPPIFTVDLPVIVSDDLAPSLACFGGLSLLCKSADDKVIIFTPPSLAKDSSLNELEILDFYLDKILFLCAGRLDSLVDRDMLIVGSSNSIIAYDVIARRLLFQKPLEESPTCMTLLVGHSQLEPMVLIGGDCFISGYQANGDDNFWLPASERVTAIGSGFGTLIVGCEDGSISEYREEELHLLAELSVPANFLLPLAHGFSFFSTSAQVHGVFQTRKRKWKSTSVRRIMAMFQSDDNLCLIYDSSTMEIKSAGNGDSQYSLRLRDSISHAAFEYAYSGGKLLLLYGEHSLTGYYTPDPNSEAVLSCRLEMLKDKKRKLEEIASNRGIQASDQAYLVVPVDLKVVAELKQQDGGLFVKLSLPNSDSGYIQSLHIVSVPGHLRGGPLMIIDLTESSTNVQQLLVPIEVEIDMAAKVSVRVFVSSKQGTPGIIIDSDISLPLFSFYSVLGEEDLIDDPLSQTVFHLSVDPVQIVNWVKETFLTGETLWYHDPVAWELKVRCLRQGLEPSKLQVDQTDAGTRVAIISDSMDFSIAVVQSLVTSYLRISLLSIKCSFPSEIARLGEIIAAIENIQRSKTMTAGIIAENVSIIKSLLLLNEEALLLEQPQGITTSLAQMQEQSKNCLLQNSVRESQHRELLKYLKSLNELIQKSANLRVGSKSDIIQKCREAIGKNELSRLLYHINL